MYLIEIIIVLFNLLLWGSVFVGGILGIIAFFKMRQLEAVVARLQAQSGSSQEGVHS